MSLDRILLLFGGKRFDERLSFVQQTESRLPRAAGIPARTVGAAPESARRARFAEYGGRIGHSNGNRSRRRRRVRTTFATTFRRATSPLPRTRPPAARFDRLTPLRYPCGREERWPSGRRRTPGKCVTPNRVRGFESHPLRQHYPLLWWLAFASSRRLVTNPVRPGREQR